MSIFILRHVATVRLLRRTAATTASTGPRAVLIPLQECMVRALQFNKIAAQPVMAHTWYGFPAVFAFSTRWWINFVLPVPPGPVMNRFLPSLNCCRAYCCSVDNCMDIVVILD